ncbi:MAG: hypothetical protein N2545_01030, partial [Thermoflexales bacterium]|nr:hypothetical protein [Thermoflexales bacterium]
FPADQPVAAATAAAGNKNFNGAALFHADQRHSRQWVKTYQYKRLTAPQSLANSTHLARFYHPVVHHAHVAERLKAS